MKRVYNTITILCFLFFIVGCDRFYVGDIMLVNANFSANGEFSYTITRSHTTLHGKLNDEFFTGNLYPLKSIQKLEMGRYPDIEKEIIKNNNVFSIARLIGNEGSIIECFIKLTSERRIKIGGIGRCYLDSNRIFGIRLRRAL